MNIKKINQGFSLIELMIAVTLGLLVLAAITGVVISTVVTNTANLNMIRLDQELRAVMLLMTRDIRRAGSWNNANIDVGQNTNCNPFMQGTNINSGCPSPPTVALTDISVSDTVAELGTEPAAADCILLTYDINGDGTLQTVDPNEQDERFGFRLSNNAIQMRQSGAGCTESDWENITDPNTITITDLDFIINTTTNTIPGSRIIVSGTDAQITVRDVTIEITGRINIGGNQTATRTIQETVRVRNDRYIPAT